MFVGHGLFAFALAAVVGHSLGWRRERVLAFGVVAGAFGLAPDVDILYAPVGVLGAATLSGAVEGFWSTGNVVHRAITHSLVVAPVAALASGLYRRGLDADSRGWVAVALGFFGLLAVVAGTESGYLGVVVVLALAVASIGIATGAGRLGLGARAVTSAALLGLVTHPFGDVFTGEPPAFAYPFDAAFLADRIALSGDPTVHLLGAMGVELATFWFAVVVVLALEGERVRDYLDPRAALGVGYAGAAFLIPAPTLDVSYQFVFSVIGLGVVSATPLPRGRRRTVFDLPVPDVLTGRNSIGVPRPQFTVDARRGVVTGLTAVTLAALTYGIVYVWLVR